jgi:hypothetical protein
MAYQSHPGARHVQRHVHGKPVPQVGLEEAEQVAQRAALRASSLTPQAMLRLQRLAGNKAVASSVQRMCGVDNSDVVVEESAMKHKVSLQGQAARLPTEDEVKKQFHTNMKYGKPEADDRDPTATKVLGGGSKMVFKKTGSTYSVFHFHAMGYEGDRESGSGRSGSSSSSGWRRGGGGYGNRRW